MLLVCAAILLVACHERGECAAKQCSRLQLPGVTRTAYPRCATVCVTDIYRSLAHPPGQLAVTGIQPGPAAELVHALGARATAALVAAMGPAITAQVVAGSGADASGALVTHIGAALTGRLVAEMGPQLAAEVSCAAHLTCVGAPCFGCGWLLVAVGVLNPKPKTLELDWRCLQRPPPSISVPRYIHNTHMTTAACDRDGRAADSRRRARRRPQICCLRPTLAAHNTRTHTHYNCSL